MKRNRKGFGWIVAGVICVIYGIMVFAVGSGTGFFVVWLALGSVLLAIPLLRRMNVTDRIPRVFRRILLVAVCICIGLFAVVEGFILSGFGYHAAPDADYLIVLGAQVYETGPSAVLKYRLDAAGSYLMEHEDAVCIVSGGQGWNEPFPEADGMKEYLVAYGIDASRIITERESKDTNENIQNSRAMLDPEKNRVVIVTNNFHVFRGCALARKAGFRHVSGLPARSHRAYLPNNLLRECFGVLKDLVQGNM